MRRLFAFLDGMTPAQARGLLVTGVISAVIASFSALGLAIYGASNAASAAHNAAATAGDIRTLLLDGKTASALAAKKTAREVASLAALQKFDHQQTVNAEKQAAGGQAAIKAIIREVEAHLDATIQRSITQAAERVAKEFGR